MCSSLKKSYALFKANNPKQKNINKLTIANSNKFQSLLPLITIYTKPTLVAAIVMHFTIMSFIIDKVQ